VVEVDWHRSGCIIDSAVVTLLILGQRKDAGHMHGSIEIAASPQQLFPWLVEGDKLKQWVSWLVEVRVPDPTVHGVERLVYGS